MRLGEDKPNQKQHDWRKLGKIGRSEDEECSYYEVSHLST
jgi:hypothetical protein